jgi:hypothetical protein
MGPTTEMDSRDSMSYSHSLRLSSRQLLGALFRSLEAADPRRVSIIHPVQDIKETSLSYLLGFEHQVGLEFLYSTGLVKKGNRRSPLSCAVVLAEWDKFIAEENLQDVMEMVNKTTVDHKKYYFIHYGMKNKPQHRPIDQFNGTMPQPSKKKSF